MPPEEQVNIEVRQAIETKGHYGIAVAVINRAKEQARIAGSAPGVWRGMAIQQLRHILECPTRMASALISELVLDI